MRHARSPALALALLAALVVAGCASDPPAQPPAPASVAVITSLDDTASLTNESLQMQAHQHDYWGGKESLVVMDAKEAGETFFVSSQRDFEMRPDAGSVVPQGTAFVDVTVSWVDGTQKRYAEPELWVRTAADHEPQLIGAVQPGATLRVPTTLANADLPHQSVSAWRFIWRIHAAEGGLTWWDGEYAIKAVAVRGLDIPVYPPHPDLWSGKETLDLLATGQELVGAWDGDPATGGNCYFQCPPIHRPENGSIVPYDAALVELVLEEGDASVTHVGVQYHAADTREWTRLTPARTEGAKRFYSIPIELGMGDSPYAAQSVWEFAPFIETPAQDSFKLGSYSLTARVLRSP